MYSRTIAAAAALLIVAGCDSGGGISKRDLERARKRDAAEAAGQIAGEVARVRKRLGGIKQAFEAAGNLRDPKVAAEITAALKDVGELSDKKDAVFRSVRHLAPDLIALVVDVYSQLQIIEAQIETHLKSAKLDEAAIAMRGALATADDSMLAKVGVRHAIGIVLTNSDDEAGPPDGEHARIVELGAVLCGPDVASAKISSTGTCADDQPVAGFLYRSGADGSPWKKGAIHLPGSLAPGQPFPLARIIVPEADLGVATLARGSEATVAETAYHRRLKELHDPIVLAHELTERLEDQLRKASQ